MAWANWRAHVPFLPCFSCQLDVGAVLQQLRILSAGLSPALACSLGP